MKTRNWVTLAIAFVLVALLTVLAVTGVQVGKYIVRPVADAITKGDDFATNTYVVYTASAPTDDATKETEDAADTAESEPAEPVAALAPEEFTKLLDETVETLNKRVVFQSLGGVSAAKQGTDKIRFQLPLENETLAEQFISALLVPGHVYFKNAAGEVVLEGERIASHTLAVDQSANRYVLSFKLDEQGTEEYAKATEAGVGALTVYMDDTLLTSISVTEQVTNGSDEMTFASTSTSALQQLLMALYGGRIQLDVQETAVGLIPAPISDAQLKAILIALAIALIAILVVLVVVFKAPGFVSALSLLLTMILTYFFFGVVPYIQFRVASIYGLIAVFAVAFLNNIEFLNRMKIEIPNAFTAKAGISAAFRTSIGRIAEYSVVPVVLALAMQYLGNSAITAFTAVFAIGSVLSFLATVLVTRPLMGCAVVEKVTAAKQK